MICQRLLSSCGSLGNATSFSERFPGPMRYQLNVRDTDFGKEQVKEAFAPSGTESWTVFLSGVSERQKGTGHAGASEPHNSKL